jgi:hypothetical protein
MSVSYDEDHVKRPASAPPALDTGGIAHRPTVVPSLASLAANAAQQPQAQAPLQADSDGAPQVDLQVAGQIPAQPDPQNGAQPQPNLAPQPGADNAAQIAPLPVVPFVPDPADLEASQEEEGPVYGPETRPIPTTRRLPRSTGQHATAGGMARGPAVPSEAAAETCGRGPVPW